MSHLKKFWSSVWEMGWAALYHSGSTPSWGILTPAGHVGHSTRGACGWKPREPARPTRMLWLLIKEKNLRSEGNWFLEEPGRPLLILECEESPSWWSWLRRWCPVALCWICSPGVCAKEKLQLFPIWSASSHWWGLKYQMYVVSACEGCWLKFLYFMSFPYWRKWPGLAPQAAALSYRRRARCRSWWLPGGSQRSAAADNREAFLVDRKVKINSKWHLPLAETSLCTQKVVKLLQFQDTGRASSHSVLDWLLDMEQEIFIQHYRVPGRKWVA